jgi:chromosome transmission fidelity protein 1
VGIYLQKFRNRLKGKNRIYVTQVVRLLDSLTAHLKAVAGQPDGIVQVGDLLSGKGVDQVNLNKLLLYLQESRLARKVEGYVQHAEQEKQAKTVKAGFRATRGGSTISAPTLTHVQSFLLALTNPSAEGRIFHSRTDENDQCLKYMLLDPTHHFRDIVQEARAVILAGGTMSPVRFSADLISPC